MTGTGFRSLLQWGETYLSQLTHFTFQRLTHATLFRSVDVVVGDQEAEVEGEVDLEIEL